MTNFSPQSTEFMGTKMGHYKEVQMSMTMLAAGADADLGDGGHVTLG